MRYCVKCGKEVERDEYIERYSMCIDCFLKYRGVFVAKPVLYITMCPRCGSWRLSGEWMKPAPLNEVIRRVFLNEHHRFVDRDVEVLDLDVTGEPIRVYKNRYRVEAELLVLFNNVVERKIPTTIEYVLEKKPCPKCIAFAGKSHKALIQIRSEEGRLNSSDKQIIEKILSDPVISSDIVEITENKYGLDIKFYTLNIAKRKGAPLSVIISDLDDFKYYVDTYGHQNGDIILKEVAKVVKLSLRETDIVCRFGGDEFAYILPFTSNIEAKGVAERVKKNVSEFKFLENIAKEDIHITLSMGIATFPDQGENEKDILSKADNALFKAKNMGKNKVIIYGE